MTDDFLLLIMGLILAFNFGHFTTLRRCESALLALSLESKRITDFDPGAMLEDLNAEVSDIVLNVVASMKQPSMADHLGGVISQFAQMRMMRMLEADGLIQAPADQPDPVFEEVV